MRGGASCALSANCARRCAPTLPACVKGLWNMSNSPSDAQQVDGVAPWPESAEPPCVIRLPATWSMEQIDQFEAEWNRLAARGVEVHELKVYG